MHLGLNITQVMLCSHCILSSDIISIWTSTGDHLDHLVNVVFARLSHCKITLFLSLYSIGIFQGGTFIFKQPILQTLNLCMSPHICFIAKSVRLCGVPQFFIFIFKKILFIREREEEREGEKHQCVVASCMPPTRDLASNPGHVPWLGIEPATLLFTDRHSVHWATPTRAQFSLLLNRF